MAERNKPDWITIMLAATALVFLGLAVVRVTGAGEETLKGVEPAAIHPAWERLLEGPVLSKGPVDAELTLIEFYSYGCGFCQLMEPALDSLRQAYPNRLRLVYIPLHMGAFGSAMVDARAAWCAGEQYAFDQVHELLYLPEEQPRDWEQIARRANVEQPGDFLSCLASDRYDTLIARHEAMATEMRVPGVPYLLINGKAYVGSYPEEMLRALVEQELRRNEIVSKP